MSKPCHSIDAMMIAYRCVYKRSSKQVIKGSRVEETIENAREEYAELLKEGWKKTIIIRSNFSNIYIWDIFMSFGIINQIKLLV